MCTYTHIQRTHTEMMQADIPAPHNQQQQWLIMISYNDNSNTVDQAKATLKTNSWALQFILSYMRGK